MKILTIETSCDDTSLAVFEDASLVAMDTKSQIEIHNQTGGVVPEVAAREHANVIFEVCETVLQKAGWKLEDIEYIGVTAFPGLIPSLLTGLTFARTLANILRVPILELDHIEGHIFANFLERKREDISFPLVCLTVSGGHNDIYFMQDMWKKERIGTSLDDAAGESYDKVAKMMWLGYPGGPILSRLASEYVGKKKHPLFPRVWLEKDENPNNFSFSGLKSAVKREVDARKEKNGILSENDKKEIAWEFQNAVNEVLAGKLISAALSKWVATIMLAGWVSANIDLQEKIASLAQQNGLSFFSPVKNIYAMDNAAMMGILAYYTLSLKI